MIEGMAGDMERHDGLPADRLTDFLDLISSAVDVRSAFARAAESAAAAFECELAVVVADGVLEAKAGVAADAPLDALQAVADGRSTRIEIAGIGECHAAAAEVEQDSRSHLFVVRLGPGYFTDRERSLLRGMGRVLGLEARLLRSIAEERAVRRLGEAEVRERKRAEALYRNLVERLPAIVYTAEPGESGRWHYVSPQVEEILGYTQEEWLSDPGLWSRILHPEDRVRALAQEQDQIGSDRDPPPIDYRMITRSGEVVWVLDEAVVQADGSGSVVWHGVLYNITERKRAEQELERRAAEQAIVAQLGERALEGSEPDELMKLTISLAEGIEGVDHACIWELTRRGGMLRLRSGLGGVPGSPDGRRISATRNSHAGDSLETGLHVVVDDWTTEGRFAMPPALRMLGVRSSLAVVISGQDAPFGVLDLHSMEPGRFTPQDANFVQSIANVLADAIERRAADQALRHRALHDGLTGLPNRLMFIEQVEDALSRAAAAGAPVAALFLDIDHFKLINDSLGHHGGDDLLRAVAPRLRGRLRPGDTVARFGGDEFGVLVEDLADESEAAMVAERIADAFSKPFLLEGVEHFITASIGIAVVRPGDGDIDADTLIRNADAAMYRAKERGRARTETFDEDMRRIAVERLDVERELRVALDRDELELQFQPVVRLATGEVTGVEALLRWDHPARGMLHPTEFVPVAEDTGLIEPIGRWVAGIACTQALAWQELHPDRRPIDVSVNLSARQFSRREMASTIGEALVRTGLDPMNLQLEITESALVEEPGATATLDTLKDLGCRLVLDDFGTGYSSLAYLNRFPLDALKIDRSFVEALGVEQERSAIVEAIIGMARALSLEVIAEGVETEAQLSELVRLGCDYAQGFLFSPPLHVDAVGRLLDQTDPYAAVLARG
jgi:diguanylate cyclase (GGDEF)-like protein/PAS domain S-box-containing protein